VPGSPDALTYVQATELSGSVCGLWLDPNRTGIPLSTTASPRGSHVPGHVTMYQHQQAGQLLELLHVASQPQSAFMTAVGLEAFNALIVIKPRWLSMP
jgi:hypothetical protein